MLYLLYGLAVTGYFSFRLYEWYQIPEKEGLLLLIFGLIHGLTMLKRSKSKRFNPVWFAGHLMQIAGLYYFVKNGNGADVQSMILAVILVVIGLKVSADSYILWLPLIAKYFRKYEVASFFELSEKLRIHDQTTCVKLIDYYLIQGKLDYIESKNGDDIFHWNEPIEYEQGAIYHEVKF
ncbi:TPA: hypothetical protein G9C53_004905 [Salmonella enterica subsp. enterica serovar Typhimurium var. 5-]|uniref:Uncharacterized protein n=1 Tax=Salmonella enterica subsp. enterica serovar Typhimurium var. 5- TaxID=1620419 RepID=A0A740Q4D0_SALTM|nr:hypothetical protein [Salmonella enterica subsp. enterica serovar Typhimurium var. 5-]